jgi:cation diffusion facilitator family transporter
MKIYILSIGSDKVNNMKVGTKVSWITISINTILSIFKIYAGVIGRSNAMLADGVHTVTDVVTTYIVIIGLRMSSKEADEEHQYGHEKFEPVCAKVISFLLIITGFLIGYEGLKALFTGNLKTPGLIALTAAFISILVKEAMYWYTIIAAKKIKSLAMEADAWHHRSDALSSIGTLLGILGARMGYGALDPIAAVIVCVFIIKIGIEYYIKATNQLVDLSADKVTVQSIKDIGKSIAGVKNVNSIKTRVFGNKIYVDMDITVEESLTVRQGHDIAEEVHDSIESQIDTVKHCMIHVEPYSDTCKM